MSASGREHECRRSLLVPRVGIHSRLDEEFHDPRIARLGSFKKCLLGEDDAALVQLTLVVFGASAATRDEGWNRSEPAESNLQSTTCYR